MKYTIIVFKNRNSTQSFASILRQNGIIFSIINTPRRLSLSCGLSIKTDYKNCTKIINIIKNLHITDFSGVYLLIQHGLSEQIEKIF